MVWRALQALSAAQTAGDLELQIRAGWEFDRGRGAWPDDDDPPDSYRGELALTPEAKEALRPAHASTVMPRKASNGRLCISLLRPFLR